MCVATSKFHGVGWVVRSLVASTAYVNKSYSFGWLKKKTLVVELCMFFIER